MLALLLQVLNNLHRAVVRRPLFVRGNQEPDSAAVLRIAGHEVLAGHEHGCQAAFHVGGAASIEHPVAQGGLKRRAVPAGFRAGGHNVGVTGEDQ